MGGGGWLLAGLLLLACQSARPAGIAGGSGEAAGLGTGIVSEGGAIVGRYLALGDSYTIGARVDAAERWPMQLEVALEAAGGADLDVTLIARSGWTTQELAGAIAEADPNGPYALVSLLVGVNDQYRSRGVESYRVEFVELLRTAVALAGENPCRVVVLSIPDWGVTPFANPADRARIGGEIDAFNAVNRGISQEAGVHYVDITAISRRAAGEPGLVAEDGLHPSAAMYSAWMEASLPSAQRAAAGECPSTSNQ